MPEANVKRGQLWQVDPKKPKRELRFQYNPESVKKIGGVGGWNVIARRGRQPITEWTGVPEIRYRFTLIFDGYPNRPNASPRSVERECRMLEEMGEPRSPGKPPPEIAFDYGPIGAKGSRTWVIDELDWLEQAERRRSDLHRCYVEVTVTILQFVDSKLALTPVEKHKQNGG